MVLLGNILRNLIQYKVFCFTNASSADGKDKEKLENFADSLEEQ